MAITKTILYQKVTLNSTDLTPHLADAAEVTVTPVNQSVDNNQTLPAAWDVSFSVSVLNNNAASATVYADSTAEPVKTNIVFTGETGAATLTISNVIVTATPGFEGERIAYVLTGTKRVTNITGTVGIS